MSRQEAQCDMWVATNQPERPMPAKRAYGMDQEFAPFCDGWSALGSTMSAGARALALSRPGPNGIRADDRAYLTGDNDGGRIALQSANRDCAGLAGQEGNTPSRRSLRLAAAGPPETIP
jgi:hypothetical protein